MAARHSTTAPRPSGDYPYAVIFEEREGLLWLEADNLARFQSLLGRRFDCNRVGFDRLEATSYILALLSEGIGVGLRNGDQVRLLRRSAPPRRHLTLESTKVWVRPEAVLDRGELEASLRASSRKSWPLRVLFEQWRASFGREKAPLDAPDVYVIKLADDMYELEWQLTSMSENSFTALALAAYVAGRALPCRLVQPRSIRERRDQAMNRTVVQEPVIYGQLRLAI